MKENSYEDKTYIFRAYFGFDVLSMIYQLRKIVDIETIGLYIYGDELIRIVNNVKAWVDFYNTWITNEKTIEQTILDFVENPYLHLKDVYDTASDTLKNHLDGAIRHNTKEHIHDIVNLGRVRRAFADED